MYQAFATLYDTLNEEDFYQSWSMFLAPYLKANSKVLDLGCGNGRMLAHVVNNVQTVTGVDTSSEMLALAKEKLDGSRSQVLLYEDDMSVFFETEKAYDTIISTCDSLNYLPNIEQLEQTFSNVYKMLKADGTFLFDMHNDKMFEEVFLNWSYGDADPAVSVIWNTFTDDNFLYEHELTFYQCFDKEKGVYQRSDELHQQYYYKHQQVKKLLEEIGFTVQKVMTDFEEKYHIEGNRVFYIVRK